MSLKLPAASWLDAQVDQTRVLPDGTVLVEYHAVHRFRLRALLMVQPFHVGTVEWMNDYETDRSGAGIGAEVDGLERQLWASCLQIASLTAQLAPRPGSVQSVSGSEALAT